jgi:hypothetical protein
MSDVVTVGSDRCRLGDLFLACETAAARTQTTRWPFADTSPIVRYDR